MGALVVSLARVSVFRKCVVGKCHKKGADARAFRSRLRGGTKFATTIFRMSDTQCCIEVPTYSYIMSSNVCIILAILCIMAVWFVQPWILYWALKEQQQRSLPHRWRIVVALVLFWVTSTGTALQLHHHDESARQQQGQQQPLLKPIVYILLGYPQAMQCLRYLHALMVGRDAC